MSNANAHTKSRRLRLSVSTFAIAATCLGMTGIGYAQTVPLTASNSPFMIDNSPGQTVEVTSGTTAVVLPAGQTWILGSGNTWAGALGLTDENWGVAPGWGGNNMTVGASPFGGANNNAAVIQVDSGATLRFLGNQSLGWGPWMALNNMIQAQGDVIFENMSANIIGNNTFAGNLTLLDNAQIYMGETWGAASPIAFGQNTNITLDPNSLLYLRLTSGFTSTAGGALRGSGTLELASGALVINGANTAANPFTGTLRIDPGATVMIGNATHSTAVLGDPGHTNGSTYALNVNGTIGGSAKLQGYGTIYGTVTNTGGIVQPGGVSGTPGTLTVSQYTQDATGALRIEVTPTAASKLNVLGNATLNGSLNVVIDPGSYSTQVYNIVTVAGTMSGAFSTITTSSGATGAIAAVTHTSNGYQLVTEVVSGANASAPVVVGHLVSANRLNNYQFVGSLYDGIALNSPRAGAEVGHNKYVWIEGFGRKASISRNAVGYHTTTEGFTAGAEYRAATNATVGLAVSYANESLKAKGASTADVDSWSVALYGGANVQYARLDGVLFYNSYDSTAKRDFQTNGVALAKPSGYAYGGSVQVSKTLFRGLVTPYMRGVYSWQHLDGSTETGATVLDLKYAAINANTFVGDFGFRINPLRSTPESTTKLLITIAIEHDFSKLGEYVSGEFPIGSGQAWNTFWKGDSENTGLVGLNIGHQLTDQIDIFGRVNGRFSLYQTAGDISIGGRWRF